ncbi:uncharacterized protein (TIGR03089 family) [Flavimobilis soli]|uniref:Uncharacterized protein (TIGR03089 family) n=1 Tax=Flavimobilis soli TaxID=442709 RepID=A0A2A9EH80_9MICO|nr:TIGR03089 family protein [Flavimobilis soli]PFG37592.1 uncharacterized protein (TIGR03089 family) [Flavimobilis soli]
MTPTTPADVLALLQRDPGRPRLTWYGDGPERIELSGAVLANWVAKTTNLLVEELDAAAGETVVLDLPAHWRTLVWALATWGTGATARLSPAGAPLPGTTAHARAIVTTRPSAWLDPGAVPAGTDVVAVALPGLARSFGEPLPPGVLDAAADTMTYGDVVGYVPPADPGADALVVDGEPAVTHADLVAWAVEGSAAPAGARALLRADAGTVATLRTALGVWAQDGSVVLLGREASERHSDEASLARLVASERITVP